MLLRLQTCASFCANKSNAQADVGSSFSYAFTQMLKKQDF